LFAEREVIDDNLTATKKREKEMTITGIGIWMVIGVVAVTYPHEYACPDSQALSHCMVRINRRAELPLNHSTAEQNMTRQSSRREERMVVRGVERGTLTDQSHEYYVCIYMYMCVWVRACAYNQPYLWEHDAMHMFCSERKKETKEWRGRQLITVFEVPLPSDRVRLLVWRGGRGGGRSGWVWRGRQRVSAESLLHKSSAHHLPHLRTPAAATH
jgi:hypothetical protein